MIEVKNLTHSYKDEETLKNISFTIQKGDFVALIGPNGAGKTTLLKLLLKELDLQKGTITIEHTPIQKYNKWSKIAYVPQRLKIDSLFPGTVKEILSLEKEKDACEELNTQHLINKQFNQLSGGEQQRVLIQLALRTKPELIILDEPTTGVDAQTQEKFYAFLEHLNKHHKQTIILVTHDVGVVPKYAKTVLCLNKTIACQGRAKDAHKLIKKAYGRHVEVHTHV